MPMVIFQRTTFCWHCFNADFVYLGILNNFVCYLLTRKKNMHGCILFLPFLAGLSPDHDGQTKSNICNFHQAGRNKPLFYVISQKVKNKYTFSIRISFVRPSVRMSRSGYPPWILKRAGLESSGRNAS